MQASVTKTRSVLIPLALTPVSARRDSQEMDGRVQVFNSPCACIKLTLYFVL